MDVAVNMEDEQAGSIGLFCLFCPRGFDDIQDAVKLVFRNNVARVRWVLLLRGGRDWEPKAKPVLGEAVGAKGGCDGGEGGVIGAGHSWYF